MTALIPARAGSKRCPGKHLRLLHGQPLIAYTIAAAQASGVFNDVQIWTDDPAIHEWAAKHSSIRTVARAPSADDEPDIAWIRLWALTSQDEAFAILRITSPFRTAATIQRAFAQFAAGMDSLRAVELWEGPHPGKMWYYDRPAGRLLPVVTTWTARGAPSHSSPTRSLPPVVRQNSSLEMAWTRNVLAGTPTISGEVIAPFWTRHPEGVAIDTEADWTEAVRLAQLHPDWLPSVSQR